MSILHAETGNWFSVLIVIEQNWVLWLYKFASEVDFVVATNSVPLFFFFFIFVNVIYT